MALVSLALAAMLSASLRHRVADVYTNPTLIPLHDLVVSEPFTDDDAKVYVSGHFYVGGTLPDWQGHEPIFWISEKSKEQFDPRKDDWEHPSEQECSKPTKMKWSKVEGYRVEFTITVPDDHDRMLAVGLEGVETDPYNAGAKYPEISIVANSYPTEILGGRFAESNNIVPISIHRPWAVANPIPVFTHGGYSLSTAAFFEPSSATTPDLGKSWQELAHTTEDDANGAYTKRHQVIPSGDPALKFVMVVSGARTHTPEGSTFEWSALIRPPHA